MGPLENPITETTPTVIQKNRDYIESLGSREEKNGNRLAVLCPKFSILIGSPILNLYDKINSRTKVGDMGQFDNR